MRQPETFYLCPFCWYYCDYPTGMPRQASDNKRCQCLENGCQHGRELMPRMQPLVVA